MVNLRFFASKVQWDFEKWTFIFVHFWEFQNTFGKSNVCEHNEKLASHHKKNNFHFVMIKFFYFRCGFFRRFLYEHILKNYAQSYSRCSY
jgi:hypothetical protein